MIFISLIMKINTNQLIQCAFFPNEAKYKKTGYYKSSERRSMIRSLVFSQRKLESPRAEGQAIISKHNSSLYNIVVCLFLRFSETMPRYICLKNQHQELFFPT